MKEKVKELYDAVKQPAELDQINLNLASHPIICLFHILLHAATVISYIFIRIIIQ